MRQSFYEKFTLFSIKECYNKAQGNIPVPYYYRKGL